MYGSNVANVARGERVEAHPATDAWMRGDKFGTVVQVLPMGRRPSERVIVRMDVSGRMLSFHPANLRPAE